jgi:enoyl-CoA hydratase
VLVEHVDGVSVITLNRPRVRNAVDGALARGVAAALDELDSRPDLRLGIITGAQGAFSAGMDLKAFVRGENPYVRGRGFAGITERSSAKPLIAAVEGFALAGGFEIVLACDLVVAGRGAFFGLPEARRGLVAAAGGLLRLPRRIPFHLAMELALTGDRLAATRAHELGLVNRLADDGGALAAARDLAASIIANGPLAIVATKAIITQSVDWPSDEQFARQARISDPVTRSRDAIEGATAFAEKRAPRWTGE